SWAVPASHPASSTASSEKVMPIQIRMVIYFSVDDGGGGHNHSTRPYGFLIYMGTFFTQIALIRCLRLGESWTRGHSPTGAIIQSLCPDLLDPGSSPG